MAVTKMPYRRTSDSLHAVLLGAQNGSPNGSSKPSSALTWHSLHTSRDPPGHFFPSKMALALGLAMLFLSLLMIGLGSVAIVMNASISSVGAGVWVGAIVGVTGFLGVCASKRPYVHVYVVSFLSVSMLSVAASGLLIVLAATAWASENRTPHIILYDKETDSEIDLFGSVVIRRPSVLVSGLLAVLGVVSLLTSLAGVAISVREACGSSGKMGILRPHPDGHHKKERLYRWLGQQKYMFQSPTTNGAKQISSVSQFVPFDSKLKREVSRSPKSPSAEPLILPLHSTKSNIRDSLSANSSEEEKKTFPISSSSSGKKNSSVVFIHPEKEYNVKEAVLVRQKEKARPTKRKVAIAPQGPRSLPPVERHVLPWPGHPSPYVSHYMPLRPHNQAFMQRSRAFQSLPCPQHPRHPPLYAPHPSLYYSHAEALAHLYPSFEPAIVRNEMEAQKLYRRLERKKEKKKKKEEKQKRKEEREKRRNAPLTDKQIDKSYTGLDREIADGFISLTMEPAASRRKSQMPTSDQESF